MMCEGFGALWLLSCIFVSLGTINQIQHNIIRRSVKGLSFFDAEIRLYGKLPWLIFACGVGATDWWILSANALGITLAMILLFQFLIYSDSRNRLILFRLFAAIFILILTLMCSAAFDFHSYQELAKLSPAFVSLCLVPLASSSQYRQNKLNACCGVSATRYFLYLISNILCFFYGIAKAGVVGPSDAWPLVLAASIGLCANAVLLLQVLREAESPIWNVAWLPSFNWATAKTPSG